MLKTTLSPIIQIGLHIAQTAPTLFHSACIQATCRCLKAAAQISIGTIPAQATALLHGQVQISLCVIGQRFV